MKHEIRHSVAIVLSLVILIAFAAPVLAQEPEEPATDCNPMAQWLAEQMGVACSELMQRNSEGVGFGEMMMAHRLAAALGVETDEMLRLKQSGLGWGQIGHAHALASAGIVEGLSLGDAVVLLEGDRDWDELRAELGLPEGPPPWAGRPAWAGRPPWAGRGDDTDADADGEDGDAGGPPPWAGGRFGLAGPGRGQQGRP